MHLLKVLSRYPVIAITIAAACATTFTAASARGEVLATAAWDTDSYVYFGTNSVTSPEITLGEPTPPGVDPHYNVGFIAFDVSGLSPAGRKYLQVEPNTGTAALPSTVRVAALLADTTGYFAAADAAERATWLATNAYAQPPAATLAISAAGGKHYADITDVVNHWIDNPAQNHGLALWRVGGGDFESPELYSMDDPMGRGPAINSVPEPSSVALAAMAAMALIGVVGRRHRMS